MRARSRAGELGIAACGIVPEVVMKSYLRIHYGVGVPVLIGADIGVVAIKVVVAQSNVFTGIDIHMAVGNQTETNMIN